MQSFNYDAKCSLFLKLEGTESYLAVDQECDNFPEGGAVFR